MMNDNAKRHAKDYLVDFSNNQDDWLKYLIVEAINTNGKISDNTLNEIYSCLKDGTKVLIPRLQTSLTVNSSNICLKKLEHISGVNALAPAQTIKFSDNITILYGLNGTGKSSYFRVLNEIVGGNEKKDILPNIYKDQSESIQVKLTYCNGNSNENELVFDNTKRSFEAFARCKVFDSSYLKGLLSERTQDETVLNPLGLHLFKYIADTVDSFKKRLKEDAATLRNSKPTISYDNFSDRLKTEFEGHNVSKPTTQQLNEKFIFPEEKSIELKKKQDELSSLNQINYRDKITVLNNENEELNKVREFLKKKEELEAFFEKATNLIKKKQEKEDQSRKVLEKIAVLKELPFSGTEEWKEFISAGSKLKEKHLTDDKTCLYCNQPLQDKALHLVNAYAEYLGDKTESELNTIKSDLNRFKKELDAITASLSFSDTLKQKYKDEVLEGTSTLFTTALSESQKFMEGFKSYLLEFIDGKNAVKPSISINPKLILWLTNRLQKNSADIETFNADDTDKNEKSKKLMEEIAKLLENQSISEQKTNITEWLSIDQREKALENKEGKITTNAITRLSNTAHEELLTLELNRAFQEELDHLDCNNLAVDLVKSRGGKGTSITKLVLKEKNSIHNILSEGEQKAVGLALFIAETKIQQSQAPIILDDPVNSLDHRIAANFANRLMELENQIIIFNHNRLFQDAFETVKTTGHICKTVDTACSNRKGKHILVYNVSSEGESRKGVIGFYKSRTFKNHINDAKMELKKSPFNERSKVSVLLRKAVECIIDECVLNGVVPTKYSNKNNRIPWDKLKELNGTSYDIEKLHRVHDRLSGGELHNGTEAENNPIDVAEFHRLVADLESVAGEASDD